MCVCVCVCVLSPLFLLCSCLRFSSTPTAAQGRVTTPRCGGETRGGSPGLTRNLGGDPAQPRRLGHGIARLTPRRPPWGATMAHGRLHRGVAVCKGAPGLPVTQPAPGLASVFSAPHPITPCVSAQVLHGVGTECDDWGLVGLSTAHPGLGMGEFTGDSGAAGARSRTCRYGAHCAGALAPTPALAVWVPRAPGECGDHDVRGGPPGYSRRDVPRPVCLEIRGGPPSSCCGGRQPLLEPGGIQRPPRFAVCGPWGAPISAARGGVRCDVELGGGPPSWCRRGAPSPPSFFVFFSFFFCMEQFKCQFPFQGT